MKRILVSKINSVADHQLVEYLISKDYMVRVIAEKTNAGNVLLQLPVEIYTGKLSDAASIANSAKGCEYIIQTQPVGARKNNSEDCQCHVTETLNIIEAARVAGVKRVVYINGVFSNNNSFNDHNLTEATKPGTNGNESKSSSEPTTIPMAMVKIILKDTARNAAGSNTQDTLQKILQILEHGLHKSTYIINDSTPVCTIAKSRKISNYFNIAGSAKSHITKTLHAGNWATTLSKLFWSLLSAQELAKNL
jgi:hypothetical protein